MEATFTSEVAVHFPGLDGLKSQPLGFSPVCRSASRELRVVREGKSHDRRGQVEERTALELGWAFRAVQSDSIHQLQLEA